MQEKKRKILVLGASKGIGRATAILFAKQGAEVTAVARSKELLASLVDEMHMFSKENHRFYSCDLMNTDCKEFAKTLLDECGTFITVVHAIGGSFQERNATCEYEEWEKYVRFNAGIAIDMNSVLIPTMISAGGGHIIHVSSISGVMLRGNPLYAAAKAYLNAYVVTTGRALAQQNILMNAVMPGAVAFDNSPWEINKKENPHKCDDFLKHHQAVGRFGKPQEIAEAIAFLASGNASFMHAALVPVDGGNM